MCKSNKKEIFIKQFKEINSILFNIIDESSFPKKDKDDLKKKLIRYSNSSIEYLDVDNMYYSFAHEVKSYDFLQQFGSIDKAIDTHPNPKPDYLFKDYNIECICSSSLNTNIKNYRVNEERKSIVNDYNQIKSIIYPRLTNSLGEKSEKFLWYRDIKMTIIKNDKNIIFLSLGDLSIDFISPDYAFDFLDILIGKGHLVFDFKDNKVVGAYYNNKESFIGEKYKNGISHNVIIDANFFNPNNNTHISGIILTCSDLSELYSFENTFLFINPYSDNRINIKDFDGIIYWDTDNENNYIPMKDGKSLWKDIEKNLKFF